MICFVNLVLEYQEFIKNKCGEEVAMGTKKQFYAVDCMKFISALLVIGIHTGPFLDLNLDANFVYVQILGRIAVPFFFVASAFFLFRKINLEAGIKDEQNLAYLKHYIGRILKIYLLWSILYLPLQAYAWSQGGVTWVSALRYIRDFLFTGSYYHLWFLPALIFAIIFIYILLFTWKWKMTACLVVMLYLIGMTGNIYGPVLEQIPLIKRGYELYLSAFETTRNGLFFGSMFIYIGALLAQSKYVIKKKIAVVMTTLSFLLLCGECFLLRKYGFMNDLASMYCMLIPLTYFGFSLLAQIRLKPRIIFEKMRKMSLLIYVSHIYFVVLFGKFLPEQMHFVLYLSTVIASIVFAWGVLAVSKKIKLVKQLY